MSADPHFYSSSPIREGFEELLHQYVQELPDKIRRVSATSEALDSEGLISELHQLAGSLGLYGYRRLEGQCRALLARLREGQSSLDIGKELRQLIDDLSRVRARPAL